MKHDKVLTSFAQIIGKTVSAVDADYEAVVLKFTDGTVLFLSARGGDAEIAIEEEPDSYQLVKAGLMTEEEKRNADAEEARKWLEAGERATLARLKAKYEPSTAEGRTA